MTKFADIFFQDYVYQQEPDGSYRFDSTKSDFALRNKNECIDTIFNVLGQIYSNIITNYKLRLTKINCDIMALDQALEKYSRDVYGELRLKARVNHLHGISSAAKKNLLKYSDYGIKIDSTAPYIHRKASVLFYWLSILKPFSIDLPKDITPATKKQLGPALEFHNEYISYILIMAALHPFGMEIRIHDKFELFKDFLYELHFRCLSRSSLEFFLHTYIERSMESN